MQFDGITGIIFDFDGTLATCPYDFAYMRQCILATAEEFGLRREQLDGLGLLESIATGAALLGVTHGEEFRAIALQRLSEIEYEAAAKTRLLPGIREALQGLRAGGYRLGIVTRNSTIAVQRILGDTVLPVEGIICREDIAHPKPHLDHAHAAMRLLDVQPDAAMMVGDHPTDIQMGKAASMATVAVLPDRGLA
jgi:phosphoglycolate phosphatase